MRGRYDKSPGKPPTLADLYYLLVDAQPTLREIAVEGAAREARRVKAVDHLRTLARTEIAKTGDPNRLRAIPDELFRFLTVAGLRILLAEDPIAALKLFLGRRPRGKGRPVADTEDRDVMIATDVAELVYKGLTIDAACDQVEKNAPVGFEMVRKIYIDRRNSNKVKGNLGMRLLLGRKEGD